MIDFKCPACGQGLEADSSIAGDLFDCPSCKRPVQVPGRSTGPRHPALVEPGRVVVVGVEIPFGQIFAITLKVVICIFLVALVVFLVAFICGFLSSALFHSMT